MTDYISEADRIKERLRSATTEADVENVASEERNTFHEMAAIKGTPAELATQIRAFKQLKINDLRREARR